jgi:hypothetical protein
MQYRRFDIKGEIIVVAFDICSSSNVLEQLTLAGDFSCVTELLTEIKRFLASEQSTLPFDPYKFTGDGWILLFPSDTDGSALLAFLRRLCRFYRKEYRQRVLPSLINAPEVSGLSFGIDMGSLLRMTMYGQREHIGRAINIACRLQNAIKDKDKSPSYKALVTNRVFREYFGTLKSLKAQGVTRTLRNINNDAPFRCRKLQLL